MNAGILTLLLFFVILVPLCILLVRAGLTFMNRDSVYYEFTRKLNVLVGMRLWIFEVIRAGALFLVSFLCVAILMSYMKTDTFPTLLVGSIAGALSVLSHLSFRYIDPNRKVE